MRTGFTSPVSVCACALGGRQLLALGAGIKESAQATANYRPEINRKGNGMT